MYQRALCADIHSSQPVQTRQGASDMHDVRATADRTERLRAGKELRQSVPREVHAELLGSGERSALAILAKDDVHRVQWLVPLRYKRMAEDSFSFLRGAAAVMAEDLVQQP